MGIFFLATPDMLSGLASWTFYDNNSDDAITAKFGSGCSSIFSEATLENSKNGKRTFIGLFDPSVRRYIHENILSFTIPMSRFREMYYTIQDSCLSNTLHSRQMRSLIFPHAGVFDKHPMSKSSLRKDSA